MRQGNLAYSYSKSMHPELRQAGQSMLGDILKAERDFDVRQEAEARADAATQAAQKAAMGETAWKRLNEVADDLTRESGNFIVQQSAYNRLTASAKAPSAAGDLALIFNYMKVLDPGSTVREGEAAAVQNAAGVPDIVRTLYNVALRGGERLTPAQRSDIVGQSTAMFNTARAEQIARNGQYLERARDGGVPAEMLDSLTIPIGLAKTPAAAAAEVPQPLDQPAPEARPGQAIPTRANGPLFPAAGGTRPAKPTGSQFPPGHVEREFEKATKDAVQERRIRQHGGTIDRGSAAMGAAAEKQRELEQDNDKALEEAGRLYTTPGAPRRSRRSR
jgi:hypothetical protein